MSEDISWLSAVIAISSGIIGVGLTCVVNYMIANKNRKVQSDLTIKEMKLKEKIEYQKLYIDHSLLKLNHLMKWNVDFSRIIKLQAELIAYEQTKRKDKVDELATEIYEFCSNTTENIMQLFPFMSIENTTQLVTKQDELTKRLESKGSEHDNFWKAKCQLGFLGDVHKIVASEVRSYLIGINEAIEKKG